MNFIRRMFNNPQDEPSDSESESEASSNPPEPGKDEKSSNTSAEAKPEVSQPTSEQLPPVNYHETQPVTVDTELDMDSDSIETAVGMPDVLPGVTRPLPQEPILGTGGGHLQFGQASDVGMVRTNNQDAAMSFFYTCDSVDERPDFGVFVVADGMGGHKEGEKASAITAKIVMHHIIKLIFLPMFEETDMHSEQPTIIEALNEAVKLANESVRTQVSDGGTTFTGVVILGDQAYVGHVGDSRAYLISQRTGIEQLTRDHSVVQRLIELETITPEEAETHEQRNVLYRAIGQNEEVEVDILRRRIPTDSRLLICSDGLWGLMAKDDLQEIVLNTPDPQEACDKLIARANTNGGTDNITAVLLKIPGS